MTDTRPDDFPCACRDYDWFIRPALSGGSPHRLSVALRRAIDLLTVGEEICRSTVHYPVGYHRRECQRRAMLQLYIIQNDARLREAAAMLESAAEATTQTEQN